VQAATKVGAMARADGRLECPEAFLDPVTFEVMQDPVSTVDGHTYERSAVEQWFAQGKDTSPLTNAVLGSTALTPNITLRNAIEQWQTTYCKQISRQSIELHEEIGTGSFKKVHRGTLRLPGASERTVAVLQVHSGDIAAEAAILRCLGRHPRLVTFYGSCTEGLESLLLTEYAPLGDVRSQLEAIEDTITPAHRLAMLQQICSGMEAVADAGLVHRDLALRNVLLFAYDPDDVALTSVKVADFGLTVNAYTAKRAYVQGGAMPVRYLSPESLRKGRYSEKSNVWAFAVTTWELLTDGDTPYYGLATDEAVIAHVVGGGLLQSPEHCLDIGMRCRRASPRCPATGRTLLGWR